MISQINDFKKIIFILNIKKFDLVKILFLILLATAIELLGLSIVIPFINQTFGLENEYYFKFLKFNFLSDNNPLTFYLILLTIIFFFKTIFSIFIKWYIGVFSSTQNANLQKRLINIYQNMDYENFISKNSSEYVRNIRELGNDCVSNIDLSLKTLAEIVVFFFTVCFLAFINLKVLLIIFFLSLSVLLIYQKFLKPISVVLGIKRNNSIGNIHRYISFGIKGMKETKILKKDNFFTDNLFKQANLITKIQKKAILINDSPKHVIEFFFLLIGVLFVYYLNITNQDLKAYFPIIGVYLLASIRLLPSISFIISSLNKLAGLYSSTNILYEDIKNFKFKENNFKKNQNHNLNKNNFVSLKSIRFENVGFKYKNSNSKVLENINFIIKENECIGIVGESGSGKSTLIDILVGLLKPSDGKIFINDTEINSEKAFNLTGNIGYLPQEPLILEDSIKTNIMLGTPDNNEENKKLNECLKKANIEKIIFNLPNGVNTLIGENGIRLSGGQNKRVALARTFFHGKKMIIMDEATTSLDPTAEDFIAEEIKNLKGTVTIVIISHTKSILKHCDKIYQIRNKSIELLN